MRHIGKPYLTPAIPSSPKARVQENTPFNITGVDLDVALTMQNKYSEKSKVNVCLFTSTVTNSVSYSAFEDLQVDDHYLL